VIAPEWGSPAGVPIDAILFGGRRGSVVPLVTEAFDWQHGTFLGATTSSETTAAAAGKVGQLRRDPMAMLPFCGYNMGDYFAHWLRIGETAGAKLPGIYYVNWFRQDEHGRFLWPGFGDNSRILKWIFERREGRAGAAETPIGLVPHAADLDLSGLDLPAENIARLLHVDIEAWQAELPSIREHFDRFGERLPQGLEDELTGLEERLEEAALRAA
jgi:phosphoenolpyruvate carboxykinase (GTP)